MPRLRLQSHSIKQLGYDDPTLIEQIFVFDFVKGQLLCTCVNHALLRMLWMHCFMMHMIKLSSEGFLAIP